MVPLIFGIGAGLLAKGIGSLIGGFGKKKGASAEAAALEAQAKAADVNRGFLERRLETELLLKGREGVAATGATSAAIGASGFTGGAAGGFGDILRQNARDIAFDTESIRFAGEAAIEQERLKAQGFRAGAKGAKFAGNIGFAGGVIDAATVLLGGRG